MSKEFSGADDQPVYFIDCGLAEGTFLPEYDADALAAESALASLTDETDSVALDAAASHGQDADRPTPGDGGGPLDPPDLPPVYKGGHDGDPGGEHARILDEFFEMESHFQPTDEDLQRLQAVVEDLQWLQQGSDGTQANLMQLFKPIKEDSLIGPTIDFGEAADIIYSQLHGLGNVVSVVTEGTERIARIADFYHVMSSKTVTMDEVFRKHPNEDYKVGQFVVTETDEGVVLTEYPIENMPDDTPSYVAYRLETGETRMLRQDGKERIRIVPVPQEDPRNATSGTPGRRHPSAQGPSAPMTFSGVDIHKEHLVAAPRFNAYFTNLSEMVNRHVTFLTGLIEAAGFQEEELLTPDRQLPPGARDKWDEIGTHHLVRAEIETNMKLRGRLTASVISIWGAMAPGRQFDLEARITYDAGLAYRLQQAASFAEVLQHHKERRDQV